MAKGAKEQVREEILPKDADPRNVISISYKALEQLFKQVDGKPLTPKDLPNWKLMLGFVNSTNNSMKTSMQVYKLVMLPVAVKLMKETVKKRKYR